jgi:hypothetical protein
MVCDTGGCTVISTLIPPGRFAIGSENEFSKILQFALPETYLSTRDWELLFSSGDVKQRLADENAKNEAGAELPGNTITR